MQTLKRNKKYVGGRKRGKKEGGEGGKEMMRDRQMSKSGVGMDIQKIRGQIGRDFPVMLQ